MQHLRRQIGLTAVLVCLAACGGGQINPVPTTVPPVVNSTLQGAATKTLTTMNHVSVIVLETVKLYNSTTKGLNLPADVDKAIRAGFVAFADESDRAGDQIVKLMQSGALSQAQIDAVVAPVLKAANGLTAVVNRLLASQRSGGWSEMLGTAVTILGSLGGQSPVEVQ